MIVDKIGKYLSENNLILNDNLRYDVEKIAGFAFRRQFMENGETSSGKLRLSGAGKCARQLAYAYHNIEKKGKETDARSKIVFFQGDLVELMLLSVARLAGCNITSIGLHQAHVFMPVNGALVEGHPDGLLLENGQIYLVEVKSMSSFGFDRFVKGEVDEGYRAQICCYLEALGLEKCVMVGLNKDAGILHETIIAKDPKVVEFCKKNMEIVLTSTPDKLPPPAYKTDEKGHYPWQCLYCAYWGHCRPNAERMLVGKSYKLKEKGD